MLVCIDCHTKSNYADKPGSLVLSVCLWMVGLATLWLLPLAIWYSFGYRNSARRCPECKGKMISDNSPKGQTLVAMGKV